MLVDVRAGEKSWADIYRLCIGFICPRPIALASTISREGKRNLAPYSFYNMVCANPPVVMISCGVNRNGGEKDTLVNVVDTREFAVATVTAPIAEPMARCGASLPWGESEFEFSGLTPTPARFIAPSLVKESPINIECKLRETYKIGSGPGSSTLIFGEILAIHVDDALLDGDQHIDASKLAAVGRLGGQAYANVERPYNLQIPDVGKR